MKDGEPPAGSPDGLLSGLCEMCLKQEGLGSHQVELGVVKASDGPAFCGVQ